MKETIVIGYSGHGYVVIDILMLNGIEVAGYCDSVEKEMNPYQLRYFGREGDFLASEDSMNYNYFVAIGDSKIRDKITHALKAVNASLVNALHPSAVISTTVKIGNGVMVAANATINPMSIIADGVVCNTASVIEHDCIIDEYAHIGPGTVLCGNVTIGKGTFIGANAVVKQGIKICDNVIVGAGSVVVKDITVPGLYYGAPACLR